jgi:hypothetical protein
MQKKVIINTTTHVQTLADHHCPFRNPIMIQNSITGEIGYQAISCNSTCPHFVVNFRPGENGKLTLNLTCGSGVQHEIDKEYTNDQKIIKNG